MATPNLLYVSVLSAFGLQLLEATADLVQTYDATQLRATGGAELQRWAALALARSGRAEQAGWRR